MTLAGKPEAVWVEQVRRGQSPERPWFSLLCATSTWLSLVILSVLLFNVVENAFALRDWWGYWTTRFPVDRSINVLVQSHDREFHGLSVPAISVTIFAPGTELVSLSDLPNKEASDPAEGNRFGGGNDSAKVTVRATGGLNGVVSGGAGDEIEIVLTEVPDSHVAVTLQPDRLLNVGFGPGAPRRVWFSPQNALTPRLIPVSSSDLRPKVGLGWKFLTSYDSLDPRHAGILAGALGTVWVVALCLLFAIPVGVGAAIYLEEYASENWLTRLIRLNLANLAGVPSIVYGILGLTAFVHMFGLFSASQGIWWLPGRERYLIPLPFGPTVLSGSLTLGLLILPLIIVATQEALRAVPASLRHASLALGATRWQTVWHQVLPASLPGVLTGVILAMSRAIGETAPLLMVGAVAFVLKAPGEIDSLSSLYRNPGGLVEAPFSSYVVIPIQVYTWISSSLREYHSLAAAGILVLLAILLVLNGIATYLRASYEEYNRW